MPAPAAVSSSRTLASCPPSDSCCCRCSFSSIPGLRSSFHSLTHTLTHTDTQTHSSTHRFLVIVLFAASLFSLASSSFPGSWCESSHFALLFSFARSDLPRCLSSRRMSSCPPAVALSFSRPLRLVCLSCDGGGREIEQMELPSLSFLQALALFILLFHSLSLSPALLCLSSFSSVSLAPPTTSSCLSMRQERTEQTYT